MGTWATVLANTLVGMELDVEGWWADALAADTPARPSLYRSAPTVEPVVEPEVDPETVRAEIAAHRQERDPLPSKGKWREVGRLLHEYDSDLCGICRTPIVLDLPRYHPGALQLDHVIPRASFGSDTWDNIQISHALCNAHKNDFIGEWDPAIPAEILRTATAQFEDPVTHRDLAWARMEELIELRRGYRADIESRRGTPFPATQEEVLEVDLLNWEARDELAALYKIWWKVQKQIYREGVDQPDPEPGAMR